MPVEPKPLSVNLNRAVQYLCEQVWPKGFDISASAPNSFKLLKAEFSERGRITVYSGNSNDTIFADTRINHMARAWHDWAHLTLNADFNVTGETAACEFQCSQLIGLLGNDEGKKVANILRAEIIGQVVYYQRHKTYVQRQMAFVVQYLNDPDTALNGDF